MQPESEHHRTDTHHPEPRTAWGAGAFVTTHWSVIHSATDPSASPDALAALEGLCKTYWYPLYAFARRQGHAPADAEDLTQGFFARLLAKDYLRAATPDKGRFRTFLLTALKAYMANEWDREHAAKRGGFASRIPINVDDAEERFSADPGHRLQPDVLFDRHWAMTLLDQTLQELRQEYIASGRALLFDYLQPCLAREESALSYAEVAKKLHLTEAAVKMSMQRFRARYRELLRDQIAHTVTSPEQLDEEMRHLFAAFS